MNACPCSIYSCFWVTTAVCCLALPFFRVVGFFNEHFDRLQVWRWCLRDPGEKKRERGEGKGKKIKTRERESEREKTCRWHSLPETTGLWRPVVRGLGPRRVQSPGHHIVGPHRPLCCLASLGRGRRAPTGNSVKSFLFSYRYFATVVLSSSAHSSNRRVG